LGVDKIRTFIGWDTETLNNSKVILISNSKGEFILNPKPIEILNLMAKYTQDKYINYFFNIDFDIKAILKTILYSLDEKDKKLNSFLRYKYLMFDKYYLSYLSKKIFTLSCDGIEKQLCFYDKEEREFITKKRIVNKKVCSFLDIFQFYKMSLKNASKIYLQKDKLDFDVTNNTFQWWEELQKDKIELNRFVKYCIQDSILAKLLSDRTRKEFSKYVKLDKLISPAYITQRMDYKYLKKRNILKGLINDNIFKYHDKIKSTYYGGRFESFKKGRFRKVFSYDINSAYPYTISKLCQLIDKYDVSRTLNNQDESYDIIKVRIYPHKFYLNPLPFKLSERKKLPDCPNCFNYATKLSGDLYKCVKCMRLVNLNDKLVYYPYLKKNIIKYITIHEKELMDLMNVKYHVLEVYHFYHNNKLLYDYIEDMYNDRLKLKNDGDKAEGILKILLNSKYGKFLEMIKGYELIGFDEWLELPIHLRFSSRFDNKILFFKKIIKSFGKMYNILFASLITGETRLRILKPLIEQNKIYSVIQIATDGIYTTEPLKLNCNKTLGNWDFQTYYDNVFYGNGLYINNTERKNRGFQIKNIKEFREMIETGKHIKQRIIPLSWNKSKSFEKLHTFDEIIKDFSIMDRKRIYPDILPIELNWKVIDSKPKYIE